MPHWLCQLRGHQRTRVVFATNRFYCRRCGIDLEPDPTPAPAPAPPALVAARRAATPERAVGAGRFDQTRPRRRTRGTLPAAGIADRSGDARP